MKWFFKKENLFVRVAVGFVLGIALGMLFPGFSTATSVAGTIYLNLIKVMIIPIVACAVFGGIANIRSASVLRKVGLRTVLLYILMFVASAAVSLVIVYAVKPGAGFDTSKMIAFDSAKAQSAITTAETTTVSSFLLKIIPSNIIQSFVNGDTLPVILFVAVFAIACLMVGEAAKPVVDFMNALSKVNFKILGYFMELSPIGVMSLMANSIAVYDVSILLSLAKYIGCCWACCIAVFFIVMMLPSCLICRIRPLDFLKACGKIALVTLSTTSSAATLPTTIRVSIDDLHAPEGISQFTLPLGCTINMCGGACSFCCLAVFTSEIYGIDLGLKTIIFMVVVATLINMAAPGIPGGGVILGASFLTIFGLPFDIMGLISGVYRILDMAFTTINVEGDVAANVLIAKSVGEYPATKGELN